MDHDDVRLRVGAGVEGVRVRGGLFGLGERAGDDVWRGADEDGAVVRRGGQDAFGFSAPGGDRSLGFGLLAEDEAEEHVEACDGEEEECGHKGEVVDVVREDLGGDPVW